MLPQDECTSHELAPQLRGSDLLATFAFASHSSPCAFDDAVLELEIASGQAGSNAYFHHHLGVVYYRLERYDDAIKSFRSALSNESGMASARYYLGESYLKLGDSGKAMEEYVAALELDPNHASARAKVNLLTAQGGGLSQD